jgi:hypothetical protein
MIIKLRKETGAAMVEFAIVAWVFFLLLFGVIEFARLLFTYNTLTEVVRRGARVAAVCPPNHPAIKRVAIFGNPSTGTTGTILPNLTTANIQLRYLNSSNTPLTNLTYPIPATPSTTYKNEWDALNTGGSVEVSIPQDVVNRYLHQLIIPINLGPISAPTFRTKLPPEALGVVNAPGSTGTGTDICSFPP